VNDGTTSSGTVPLSAERFISTTWADEAWRDSKSDQSSVNLLSYEATIFLDRDMGAPWGETIKLPFKASDYEDTRSKAREAARAFVDSIRTELGQPHMKP
jgi:hypothetical protein